MCPAWYHCNKKSCTENERCCSAEYWASLSMHVHKVQQRIKRRSFLASEQKPCVRSANGCDKWEACSVLNECVAKIPRFQNKPKLLKALCGPKSLKQIIAILKTHDPEPMKSYYLKK